MVKLQLTVPASTTTHMFFDALEKGFDNACVFERLKLREYLEMLIQNELDALHGKREKEHQESSGEKCDFDGETLKFSMYGNITTPELTDLTILFKLVDNTCVVTFEVIECDIYMRDVIVILTTCLDQMDFCPDNSEILKQIALCLSIFMPQFLSVLLRGTA